MSIYPKVKDPKMVGEYPAESKAGGGYVWDEVLEYRVWCHPHDGAPDLENGSDYYYAFETYEEAKECSSEIDGSEEPLALILQVEHINEPTPGVYEHKKESRVTEWPVEFLSRPRRTENTIPDFMSPNAPENKLDVIRGLA
ncbi:GCN5 family acetyltransferase [Pseudoalteromonas sp. PS5]|uniref:GCN5 family acetyltransferase n=1 Tax=Pseudoalteromonas sp. PS5 TaxID=1437473 RepID=UPI000FFE8D30|nr:GCN5 family acetyltransferase [Pseudoalteromonas sp. PS5]RXF04584.1 GCN5 family acetyltransferase [Pseudoalteromonas sp. PS5]